jgi:DNA-binding LacI/PurR family transcriptional regulator
MGRLAAETLLARIEGGAKDYPAEIPIEPELVVRQSTGVAPKTAKTA